MENDTQQSDKVYVSFDLAFWESSPVQQMSIGRISFCKFLFNSTLVSYNEFKCSVQHNYLGQTKINKYETGGKLEKELYNILNEIQTALQVGRFLAC